MNSTNRIPPFQRIMSKYPPKNLSANPKERPNHSNLVEETKLESDKPRQTPRFSDDVVERKPTAKRHSFSQPDRMGRQNSDGPDRFIPGAFPPDTSAAQKNPQHNSNNPSLTGHKNGVRVGTGLMLQDDAENPDEIDRSQLPSLEQPSLSPVGVGSLPGTIQESGVAILPEERVHPDPYLRGYTVLDAGRLRRVDKQLKRTDKHDMPTTEQPSGSRVGIGSMPGTIHEGGVATLPEERIDGRPYGSGHTGFEDTLGKGHTIRQIHPFHNDEPAPTSESNISVDNKARKAPIEQPQDKSPPKSTNAKIVVDDRARRALNERNPVRAPLEKHNTFPFSAHPSCEQSLPGDTIFSATQRAQAHDPNFIHASGGQTFADRPINESATITPEQRHKMAQNLVAQGEQSLQTAAHAGASALETVEGAAIGAMHGAEHMFHNIESSAKAYIPDVSRQGAENFLHNIESGTRAHMPNVPAYFKSGSSNAVHQNRLSPAPGSTGTSATNTGFFITSGVDAPHSKSKDFATSRTQNIHPGDKDITESMAGTHISENHSQRSKEVEKEYHKRHEYDMYGEELDMHQFVYDDDFTTGEEDSDLPPSTRDTDRDLASDRARGSYVPGDGAQAKDDSADVLYGHGGVGYNRYGKEGVLPGYPTPEGMNKLISDRMKDDHLRATGDVAANQPKTRSYAESDTSSAMQGPIADGMSVDTDHYDNDITLVQRNPEEVREVPIFDGGKPTASGKFEAVFEPGSGQRHGPDFSKSKLHQASKNGSITGEMKVGYLGKPVSEEEEATEIERARRAAARRMGID